MMATRQPMSLKVRYILALSFIALLSLASYLVVRGVISAQQGDAAVINVSGRQRMLSQRIGLFANLYVSSPTAAERAVARAELERALDLFESSHEAILQGGTVQGFRDAANIELTGQLSEGMRTIYYGEPALNDQVREFVLAGRSLLAANPRTLSADNPALQYLQAEGPNRLLDTLNIAVASYQQESEADIFALEVQSALNLIIIWAVLLITGLFVFRPMDIAIENNTRQLEEQNAKLLSTNRQVEEQAEDLELAFRVSHVMGRINDINVMLNEAVNLLQERFGLYYVQVYLADRRNRTIYLRAGSGDVGQRLAEKGHRLPIGVGSINGRAAAERQTIVVPNTAVSNSFRPNPLLPLTRSELSVPLLVEDALLGVLNLQSSVINELNEEKTAVFEALASQLAVAIDNAMAYADLTSQQKALIQQNKANQQELWESFFDAIHQRQKVGYIYENNRLSKTEEIYPSPDSLVSDIQVNDVAIGTIQLTNEEGDLSWSRDEQLLLDGVAEQVARHIENLRLLAQTERYRNEAELVTKRITQRNWQELLSAEQQEYGYRYDRNEIRPLTELGQPDGTRQPLLVNGEAIGYLATDKDLSDEESQQLLGAVADQLGAHLENLRLSKKTEEALAETERLYRAGRILTEADTPQALLNGMMDAIQDGTEQMTATLFITHVDKNNTPAAIEQLCYWPMRDDYPIPNGTIFDLSQFSTSELWRYGDSLLVENMEMDSRIDEESKAVYRQLMANAFGVLPLRLGSQWVGALSLNWVEVRRFDEEQRQFYDALTRQAAVVLNNQFLLRQTQEALEETATQAKRLEVLNNIGSRLGEAVTLDEVFVVLSEEVKQVIQQDRLSIALRSLENEDTLDLYTLTAQQDGKWPMREIKISGTQLGTSMPQNSVLLENDVQSSAISEIKQLKQLGMESSLVGPLIINNQSIGTINISSREKDAYDEQDTNIMQQLTNIVSATIQSIRSLEESRNRARELTLVNEIGQVISLLNDTEGIFEAVLMQLQQVISVDAFMVGLYDHQSKMMNFAFTYDDGERFEPYVDTLSATSRMRQVLETGEPIFIARSLEEAQAEKEDALKAGTSFGQVDKMSASLIYVPLKIGDNIAGCMTVQSYQFDAYSRSDLALLMGIATYMAIAFEKVDLIQRIENRARRERLINEISNKIQQSVTVEGALQTAVRELGLTFQAEQTQVALTSRATPTNGSANGQS